MACAGAPTTTWWQAGALSPIGSIQPIPSASPTALSTGDYFLRMMPEEDRYVCDAEFVTDPPTPFRNYQWSQDVHERAIKEAGFPTFAWHPSEVSPEDVARYGEAYWQDFYDNCLVIGLVCPK